MANNQMDSLMSLLNSNPDTLASVSNVIFESTNYELVERPMSKAHPDTEKVVGEGYGYEFNRGVNEDHVRKLVKDLGADIARGGDGFARHLPILLSAPPEEGTKAKILDGQHRFEAMCRINEARQIAGQERLPFFYTIHFAPVGVKDIAGINSTSRTWRLADYVKAFAASGNESYKRLIEIQETYGVPFTAFTEKRAEAIGVDHLFSGDVKDGTFRFHQYETVIKFLDEAKDLTDEVTQTFREGAIAYPNREVKKWKLTMSFRFVWALYRAYKIKGFDKARFRMKLTNLAEIGSSKILGLTNTTGSLATAFLLVYNDRPRDIKYAYRAKDLMFKPMTDSDGVQDTSFNALQIVQKDIPR